MLSKKIMQGLWCAIFTVASLPSPMNANNAPQRSNNREVFDFVVVGAGNAGCVIANRLSENGKYTVCLMEYGRDDARAIPSDTSLLPLPSPANVPQPGDYNWGLYTRGGPAPTEFAAAILDRGFGHFEWFQKEDEDGPDPFRPTTYPRHAGWGGCTSHNFTFSIRNAPYNWDEWVARGLTDWDASTPTSNLIPFYEKVENRSQLVAEGVPFYNPAIPEPKYGSFPNPQEFYGYNGMVPILNFGPTFLGKNPYTQVLLKAMRTVLSAFDYPSELIDLDWPPTASQGGLTNNNFSQTFQSGLIVPPGESTPVPFATYNFPLYGDSGFVYPPEFARLGLTGLVPVQRVNAANTYLYAALNREQGNLKVKSEVLVTKVIIKDGKARGVNYLEGWNIYQTGRNNNVQCAGYGGTSGDARANAIIAQQKGEKAVYARKEVILCAGVFNTPQLLQLSGVGNKDELKALGIKTVYDLPGVGEHLIDNQELFIYWEGLNPGNVWTLAAKSDVGLPNPNFDLIFGLTAFTNEARDAFVQKRWAGLKNLPAIYQSFARNDFENILLDSTDPAANLPSIRLKSASVAPVAGSAEFSVTFSIPKQPEAPPAGGYVVVNSRNPKYNGTFYSSATTRQSITLTYPSNPGKFSGVAKANPPAIFKPIIKDNAFLNGLLVEQEENNLTEGSVKIVSKDPTVPPQIIFNYLQDKRDLQVWLDVFNNTIFPVMLELKSDRQSHKYFTGLLDPSPIDFLKPGVTYENWHSVSQVDQERLTNYLVRRCGGHHAGGTCKMGVTDPHHPLFDPLAVVDQKGRVKGVKGLRICDNSVVPVTVRWPNISLYVIGEKISADILAEYSQDRSQKQ